MAVATLQTSNELIQAIFRGNHEEFAHLLDPESANYQDAQKRSVLHAAAHCGEARIAELLLKEGARVNAKDTRWFTPLHRACASNSAEVVRILLAHGADRNARDKSWQTPLHVAAANASLECVQLLFTPADSLTNVNASDRNGHSPLHHAVYGGHIELVELLHQFGAEVNCRDKDQYTPLHAASALGHVATANALIALGAELEATTSHGNTPLHIACLNGRDEMVELLLRAIKRSKSETVLSCVSPNGSSTSPDGNRQKTAERAAFDALVKAVNQLSEPDHMTPLHLAVSSTGGAYCLRHLLDATTPTEDLIASAEGSEDKCLKSKSFANLQATGGEDESHPIHMAAFHARFDRAQLLLDHGAKVDARDRLGNTALHVAADRGHELFVLTMLRAGCPWNARGQGGTTALHRAALSGFASCLSRLIAAALLDQHLSGSTESIGNTNLDLDNLTEWAGSPEALERLHELVRLADDDGRTVVHAAALGTSLDCLKLTLLAGGDPFAADHDGRTPLHYAVASCAFAVRNPRNSSGSFGSNYLSDSFNLNESRSLIYRANAITDATNASLVFLKLGAHVNAADRYGCTPLHFACAYDTTGVLVKYLLSYGADPTTCTLWPPVAAVPDGRGSHSVESASHDYGSEFAREPPAASLRECRYSPLHLAVSAGNEAAVRLLLNAVPVHRVRDYSLGHVFPESGPNLVSIEQHKSTAQAPSPLLIAALRGNESIMKMLLHACTTKVSAYQQSTTQSSGSPGPTFSDLSPERITNSSGQTMLMLAAYAGHTDICRLLLSDNRWGTQSLVEAKDAVYRWTALHHAAAQFVYCDVFFCSFDPFNYLLLACFCQGHSDIVSLLLDFTESRTQSSEACSFGGLRCEPDEHGRTALMLAAQNNHGEVVRLLLSPLAPTRSPRLSPRKTPVPTPTVNEDRYRVNTADVYGRTALHRAIANGHVECAKLLLSHGCDPFARDFRGRHALHMAATGGRTATLALLVSHITELLKTKEEALDGVAASEGLQPLDEYGFSPLHFAACRGHLECLRLLLNCPCYKRLRDGRLDCLQPLLERFGSQHLTTKDAESRTVLHIAALCNQVPCLNKILAFAEASKSTESDLPPETPRIPFSSSLKMAQFIGAADNAGQTALMLAASSGATSAVERLLAEHKRWINVLSEHSNCELESADADLVDEVLRQLSVGVQDCRQRSALHHACMASDDAPGLLVLQAMQDDAFLSSPDVHKRTPLHLAISSGLVSLVEALIARGADLYAVDTNGLIPVMSCVSSTQVATCLSLVLAAMFPPLDGAPDHVFLCASPSRSSALLFRTNSNRALHRPDSEKTNMDGPQLMSTSMVQTSQPVMATMEPLENGRASRPLSYPGSESDFF
ncbi:Serine/threonine-protein phosphatase 6 regulatory ankyrin repeat subunit A [Fasciola gigantica]|uniref:Serine/threonine-protein phosphatase 6 regulatory ankyrin repeat subunit A n=1 Tax=Fasciola gigantica TaxID=46835 RepID=A0A504YZ78_FASGI|nr:Serine/threonine-protein phosphatase 6 regulatory ankyrin repeat subunit A [Fasciola gigantica]